MEVFCLLFFVNWGYLVEITAVIHSISLIAILIILGAFVAKSYPFNKDTRQMFITLITNVAMPAIILSSIFSVEINRDTLRVLLFIFVLSIMINLAGLLLGYLATLIFKRHSEKKIEIAILSAFGNTGFIGIPLSAVLFGPEGALYAAIFDAGVDFTIWTVGVYLLQDDKKFSFNLIKNLINIPIVAIVLGLIIASLGINMPLIVTDLADMLAAFAVPLAMFFIGAVVSDFQRGDVKISYFEVTTPIFIKLILLPFIVIFFLYDTNLSRLVTDIVIIQSIMPALTLSSVLFSKYSKYDKLYAFITILFTFIMFFFLYDTNLSRLVTDILIIQSMMPALTLSSVLFAKYSRDDKLGAFITILSTFASLLVIPLILYIINHILI